MAKPAYYGGIGIMGGLFLLLVLLEHAYQGISSGAVGGAIAAGIVVGGIIIAFSDGLKWPLSRAPH